MHPNRMPGSEQFIFAAVSDRPEIATAYVALKDAVFADDGWALFDFSFKDLSTRKAWVAAVVDDSGDVVTGLHAVIDGAGVAHIQGVVTNPAKRSAGACCANLTENVFPHLRKMGISTVELVIRVLSDDLPNKKAFRAFEKSGFRVSGQPVRIWLSRTPLDNHLVENAEAESAQLFIRVLPMRLTLKGA